MKKVKPILLGVFAAAVIGLLFVHMGNSRLEVALSEGLQMLLGFLRQHLLYALAPSLALAAVISVSISKPAIIRHMSAAASKVVAYAVAAVSGAILSVCSCSVLPLFAGIRRAGAGLGPAVTFLYAGPAINVLAIVLTARVLGWQIGLARGIGAVGLGIAIGLAMSALFGRHDRADIPAVQLPHEASPQPLWRVAAVIAVIILITIFLTWSPSGFKGVLRCCPDGKTASTIDGQLVGPTDGGLLYRDRTGAEHTIDPALVGGLQLDSVVSQRIYNNRFAMAGLAGLVLVTMLLTWFRGEAPQWGREGWLLTRQIVPLLLVGVFFSGMLLGRPGKEGLVPSQWIASAVGGNSVGANLLASLAGALMYFATLTEVPVVQGLMNSGMGHGPALAMLLAGPAVSLPSLLVLGSIMGWRKTLAYTAMVVVTATLAGFIFGMVYP